MTIAATVLRHPQSFDDKKAKDFAGKMLASLNAGAQALMASIGHRTGLFDHLARLSPTTSQELAAVAGLSERYVREWLAVMTTSRVIDYAPASSRYALPPEHAAFLTRGGPMKNLAVIAQFMSVVSGLFWSCTASKARMRSNAPTLSASARSCSRNARLVSPLLSAVALSA